MSCLGKASGRPFWTLYVTHAPWSLNTAMLEQSSAWRVSVLGFMHASAPRIGPNLAAPIAPGSKPSPEYLLATDAQRSISAESPPSRKSSQCGKNRGHIHAAPKRHRRYVVHVHAQLKRQRSGISMNRDTTSWLTPGLFSNYAGTAVTRYGRKDGPCLGLEGHGQPRGPLSYSTARRFDQRAHSRCEEPYIRLQSASTLSVLCQAKAPAISW